jgi:hypothetical protein
MAGHRVIRNESASAAALDFDCHSERRVGRALRLVHVNAQAGSCCEERAEPGMWRSVCSIVCDAKARSYAFDKGVSKADKEGAEER